MNDPQQLDLLDSGTWTTTPPLADFNEDLDAGLRSAGYERFARFGDTESGFVDTELALEVYRRNEYPRFLLVVSAEGGHELIAASKVPDAMALMAQWVPAVQASASTTLFTALADDKDRALTDGLVRVLRQGRSDA